MKQVTRSHLMLHGLTTAEYQALGHETISNEQRARQGVGGYRWKPGDNTGAAHPRYKGGHINKRTGYRMMRDAGRLTYEHRIVMRRHLGRALQRWEIVHHVDGNPLNNDIANLELMTQTEHRRRHADEGTTPPPPRNWRNQPHKALDVGYILAQHLAGRTDADIARELSVERGTIRRRLLSAGIKRSAGRVSQCSTL